ncbi:MAG: 3-isopropylmalate dehydratase small subunit [Chloroflexi bacterium AL-W]|nr:3-isopropylmalate dehydratase small subunit [Chloroflexi bacterium AL-N1]NOK67516.1 3-isopropylmalate dehydratase small subunit [Chloroflexi bacterium AL-N10]NOK74992.1 3-isopropylmalate dehydratase small subunit [Chloroflexi bacterium AL-N5]NOK81779.1 3-isopropylmalate dehydratase small subunit [Chloroflexi bacterium AL-W]NOK89625.1 3-isopropylmalate dehydratase small subunit [Chloroflexi bacterium AL-N15]
MKPIQCFSAKIVVLPVENVDTDQIIPARYLKTTNKTGLGDSLFADWRYNTDGQPKEDFVLNRPDVHDVEVLVAGNNFGCGSSREHAPWALLGYGFRAVISTYFADIFQNNALKNGLLPITVDTEIYTELAKRFAESPEVQVTVDLESQTLTLPGGRQVTFPVDPFAKHCLLKGVDQMGFLLAEDEAIASYEATHAARVCTVVT